MNYYTMTKKAEQMAIANEWSEESFHLNNQILKVNKYNEDAHCRIGRFYEEHGDYKNALRAYHKASCIDPKFEPYKRAMKRMASKLEEMEFAEKLDAVVDSHQAFTLGKNERSKGHIHFAVLAFEKSLQLNKNTHVMAALAATYRSMGDARKAISIYRETLKLEPESNVLKTGLAAALKDNNRRGEAKELINSVEDSSHSLRVKATLAGGQEAVSFMHQAFITDLSNSHISK